MSPFRSQSRTLEELLAGLLRYGTWIASAAIGVGIALAILDPRLGALHLAGMRIATVGVILFILLPSTRVLLMLTFFLRDRDYPLAITAAVVLAIIVLGFLIGMHSTAPMPD